MSTQAKPRLVEHRAQRTIQTIGHDNGWPTEKQRAAWEAEKAERARWQSLIGYAVEQRTQDDT